tara:strand:+ start:473 stop:604 length:132 start_codon:yes stop_codon:yes gene_type:complete
MALLKLGELKLAATPPSPSNQDLVTINGGAKIRVVGGNDLLDG